MRLTVRNVTVRMTATTISSFDALSHALTTIATLANDEVNELKTKTGMSTIEDLSFIAFADLKDALPTVATIKLRKLELVIKYLVDGQTLRVTTTATTIQKHFADIGRATRAATSSSSSDRTPSLSMSEPVSISADSAAACNGPGCSFDRTNFAG